VNCSRWTDERDTPKDPVFGYTERMNTLLRALETTPLKRRLLPSYTGPCSVGVVTHPEQQDVLAVEVRLPEGSAVEVAPSIDVDGHQVTVIVRHDYRPIQALASR